MSRKKVDIDIDLDDNVNSEDTEEKEIEYVFSRFINQSYFFGVNFVTPSAVYGGINTLFGITSNFIANNHKDEFMVKSYLLSVIRFLVSILIPEQSDEDKDSFELGKFVLYAYTMNLFDLMKNNNIFIEKETFAKINKDFGRLINNKIGDLKVGLPNEEISKILSQMFDHEKGFNVEYLAKIKDEDVNELVIYGVLIGLTIYVVSYKGIFTYPLISDLIGTILLNGVKKKVPLSNERINELRSKLKECVKKD